jgi:predicted GNAT family acetyltransferase
VNLFGRKKREVEEVQSGQFELEQNGHIAKLDYMLDSKVLTLLETTVPDALRGTGIAKTLAKTALDWARERGLKVDVVCPFVFAFVHEHPAYADLVLK